MTLRDCAPRVTPPEQLPGNHEFCNSTWMDEFDRYCQQVAQEHDVIYGYGGETSRQSGRDEDRVLEHWCPQGSQARRDKWESKGRVLEGLCEAGIFPSKMVVVSAPVAGFTTKAEAVLVSRFRLFAGEPQAGHPAATAAATIPDDWCLRDAPGLKGLNSRAGGVGEMQYMIAFDKSFMQRAQPLIPDRASGKRMMQQRYRELSARARRWSNMSAEERKRPLRKCIHCGRRVQTKPKGMPTPVCAQCRT
jgi:hypothetical protein